MTKVSLVILFYLNLSSFILNSSQIQCLEEQYFKVLLSKEWLTNDKIIITIIETSKDYMNDLSYLKSQSQTTVLLKWHNRIKAEYMKGFLQK